MKCTTWLLLCVCSPLLAQEVPPASPDGDTLTDSPITIDMADGTLGGDLVTIYETAVATMRKTCDDYRRIRALELSITRDIAFREAYDVINDVMPILDPIDRDLLREPVRLPDQVAPHRAEVEKVQSQVEAMIELTAKLLEEIEKVEMIIQQLLAEKETTLEEIVQRDEYDPTAEPPAVEAREAVTDAQMQKLVEMARQDREASQNRKDFKDLTTVMREIMHTRKQTAQEALERRELDTSKPLVAENDHKKLNEVAKLDPKNVLFGRVVGPDGEPAEWMFIDTWYTIGPFPNPSRVNLNRKFPPETVVNLDAVYEGADGAAIRWEFVQSRHMKVVPANPVQIGIWYAYTEIWFDSDMDLWVVIGSDDKGNVWLNDLPIWVSTDWLKPWRVDEGFRKVAFKAGRNRILYRVENGWRHVILSFGIHVAE